MLIGHGKYMSRKTIAFCARQGLRNLEYPFKFYVTFTAFSFAKVFELVKLGTESNMQSKWSELEEHAE